ncbi:MAG: peptidylprolyl isomerase [Vicinamibacterales bacterium]
MFNKLTAAALLVLAALVPVRADILEQVLVKVNGDIVTKTEFEQRQIAALRQRQELASVAPDSPELRKAVAEITPELILSAVDELLLVQRGRELGYALGDEQFASILDNIKKENKLESDEQFQAALKQEGLTLAELRRSLERQMLISRVQQQEVMGKIAVTEDEAKAYYERHRNQFTTPSAITLREILIEVPASDKGINVAQDEAARDRAQEVRERLLAGEPFARLAADLSDAPSKANGGLIGPINSTDLAPALAEMLQTMKPGELTEAIRTTRGYQILKLESRTDEKIRSFDAARDEISDRVADEKRRGEMQKYVERLRAQAIVSWKNDELKKAYDQALADRKARLETAMR